MTPPEAFEIRPLWIGAVALVALPFVMSRSA